MSTEAQRARCREWKKNNPELVRQSKKRSRDKNGIEGLEKERNYYRDWKKRNPDYHTKYFRKRKAEDPAFKMRCALACRISIALRGTKKSAKTLILLGCTLSEFMTFIEEQWTEGMCWHNYGIGAGKWTIDHIRPCASFDLLDVSQQKECFHYSNLKPCWHSDNVSKGSLWNGKIHRYKQQLKA